MAPEDLRQRVAALKHDLGKYVAWMSSNFAEESWQSPADEALVEALRRDLLGTGQRDGRDEPAWKVWERLSRDLGRPLPAPELDAVERAVHRLQTFEVALQRRDVHVLSESLAAIRSAQGEIRTNLARLHRRLLEA